MTAFKVLLKFILLVVLLLACGICEEGYQCGFEEGFSFCKDFNNTVFQADKMELVRNNEDGVDTMNLAGYFEFFKPVDEGSTIAIDISKETELGNEPMWACTADLCASLKDESAPWAAAMEAMKITKCPIDAGQYPCENFTLDLSFMNDVMDDKYVGTYGVKLEIKNENMDAVACHTFGLAIKPLE